MAHLSHSSIPSSTRVTPDALSSTAEDAVTFACLNCPAREIKALLAACNQTKAKQKTLKYFQSNARASPPYLHFTRCRISRRAYFSVLLDKQINLTNYIQTRKSKAAKTTKRTAACLSLTPADRKVVAACTDLVTQSMVEAKAPD